VNFRNRKAAQAEVCSKAAAGAANVLASTAVRPRARVPCPCLQNAVLASNLDKGGIRVQYSRNPYGKKRDVTGKPSSRFLGIVLLLS